MTKPATTPLQALRRTRKILDDPERWIKGEWVSTLANEGIRSSGKVCYCMDGALIAAVEGATHRKAYEIMVLDSRVNVIDNTLRRIHDTAADAFIEAANALYPPPSDDDPWSSVIDFNDMTGRTHDEIIAVLDHAIAKLEVA